MIAPKEGNVEWAAQDHVMHDTHAPQQEGMDFYDEGQGHNHGCGRQERDTPNLEGWACYIWPSATGVQKGANVRGVPVTSIERRTQSEEHLRNSHAAWESHVKPTSTHVKVDFPFV